jgi:hypothetical protein
MRTKEQILEDNHFMPRHFARRDYNQAAFLAEYYTWLVRRGHDMAGNDPITGKPREKAMHSNLNREESNLVHKVQARFWLNQAKQLRRYGQV